MADAAAAVLMRQVIPTPPSSDINLYKPSIFLKNIFLLAVGTDPMMSPIQSHASVAGILRAELPMDTVSLMVRAPRVVCHNGGPDGPGAIVDPFWTLWRSDHPPGSFQPI